MQVPVSSNIWHGCFPTLRECWYTCRNMAYDGIVLEAWTAWAMYDVLDKPDLRQKVML